MHRIQLTTLLLYLLFATTIISESLAEVHGRTLWRLSLLTKWKVHDQMFGHGLSGGTTTGTLLLQVVALKLFPLWKTRPQTFGLKQLYDPQHNTEKLQEIHPSKGEPSSAAEVGCSSTLAKQAKLVDSCRHREVMKLVAGYVVDEMLLHEWLSICQTDLWENNAHR